MWGISRHAAERILDMGIDPDEVWNCINNPDAKRRSRTRPNCHLYSRGRLELVLDMETNKIVTALWNQSSFDRKDDLKKATTTGPKLRVFYGARPRRVRM